MRAKFCHFSVLAGLLLCFVIPAANAQQQETPVVVTIVGSGTVESSPSGISCPGVCAAPFPIYNGTNLIYLTATPASGYTFQQWEGTCFAPGYCTTINAGSNGINGTILSMAVAVPSPPFVFPGNGYDIDYVTAVFVSSE